MDNFIDDFYTFTTNLKTNTQRQSHHLTYKAILPENKTFMLSSLKSDGGEQRNPILRKPGTHYLL